jgi:hypothetical protein
VAQGGSTGYLAGRIGELGRALAGFAQEIGPQAWNDTLVVVISEFGRTFRENGNKGTDHGHGSVYWVLGGTVKGGRMAGEQVKVDHATLFQNRDYPVLTDYRALLRRIVRPRLRPRPEGVAAGVSGGGPEGSGAGVIWRTRSRGLRVAGAAFNPGLPLRFAERPTPGHASLHYAAARSSWVMLG